MLPGNIIDGIVFKKILDKFEANKVKKSQEQEMDKAEGAMSTKKDYYKEGMNNVKR
jgi:hypothetical protein